MRYRVISCLAVAAAVVLGAQAAEAQTFIYPSQGQSPEQQNRDHGECHVWAVQQSGYDPANPAIGSAPRSNEPAEGGVLRGGARGAAAGAVVGAIGGNAGRGAAMGAAGGALIGGMRRQDQRRRQQAERDQFYEQQRAAQQQGLSAYNRAFAACMQGRGYTVN